MLEENSTKDHKSFRRSGVGVSVVNALSEWMWVEVKRDGGVHRQDYKIGEPQNKLKTTGKGKNRNQSLFLS